MGCSKAEKNMRFYLEKNDYFEKNIGVAIEYDFHFLHNLMERQLNMIFISFTS